MNANRFMKITAAVMTAAMLAAAVPASAAPIGTTATQPTAVPTVVQEVYGDIYGLYFDMGYTYSDGSYLIENPIPIGRSMNKWPFALSIFYKSDSTADNRMGNGISCTYDQKLVRNSESSFTYIDEKGVSHEIWYDARTGAAGSLDGPVELIDNEYRYQLKFGDDFEKWFDKEDGDLIMYFTNTDPDGATKIYRDEDGSIQEVLCKDYSHYRFSYDTLADGSKRVSALNMPAPAVKTCRSSISPMIRTVT
ncbi:MAG: DUF6531 domain-containing protein [Oscillospiraceae bacterium]